MLLSVHSIKFGLGSGCITFLFIFLNFLWLFFTLDTYRDKTIISVVKKVCFFVGFTVSAKNKKCFKKEKKNATKVAWEKR